MFFEVKDALFGGRIVFCAGVREIRIGLEVLPLEPFSVHEQVHQAYIGVHIKLAGLTGEVIDVRMEEVMIEMSGGFLQQLALGFSDRFA